jgi:hypothetical protein
MCTNDRPVKDASDFVITDSGSLENIPPNISPRPVAESAVHRFPFSKSSRKIAPRRSRFCNVQHGIDKIPIGTLGWSPKTLREQITDFFPLVIGKLMSSHPDAKIKQRIGTQDPRVSDRNDPTFRLRDNNFKDTP